jgi:PIN domain nuclease of toxin-antitoxin system
MFSFGGDQRSADLNASVRTVIEDPLNNIFVSTASIWEIAIKRHLDKLVFHGSASAAIGLNGFHDLPVLPVEAEEAGNLSSQHTDPFDRMLVAQAMRQGLVLVTGDRAIRDLDVVARLWAR